MAYLYSVLPVAETMPVFVKVTVDPAQLEDLLECLADLNLSIDPAIQHGPQTVLEFRVSDRESGIVRKALRMAGFRRVGIFCALADHQEAIA